MLSLFRKEVTCSFFILLSVCAEAQVKTRYQPNYDAKPLRFGYYIGYATTHYNIKYKPSFFTPDNYSTTHANGPVYAVTSPNTVSIRAGAMVNYFINDYFDIRFSPLNISIQERAITYIDKNNEEQKNRMGTKAWLEVPFHVKYKSERRNNSRMYIFAGTRWGFETNPRSKRGGTLTNNKPPMKTNDLTLEYGMGLEIFREYFKVTPELHFSHGIFNMNRKNSDLYFLNHVKNVKTHSVSLLILFQ